MNSLLFPRCGFQSIARQIITLLLAVSALTAGSVAAENDALPYRQEENVVVALSHGIAVTMDVFTPKQGANGIGLIDVASGAWSSDRSKIRDHKLAQMYNIFCLRGYTVFAIRPGSVSRFSAPDMVGHLEAGIKEVKKRADQYGINPDRLGITGASAGGHLASLVALNKENGIVAAGVFFPPTDFIEYGEATVDPTKLTPKDLEETLKKKKEDLTAAERISLYVRKLAFSDSDSIPNLTADEIVTRIKAISPLYQVNEDAPPFLLIHGDADEAVPLHQSEKLLAALKSKNVPAELIIKEGGGHPWPTIFVEVARLANWFDEQYAADKSDN